uniref:AH domain-containing protein n=1 Tax=Dracunculus medinensis TaxID=318479 RepID=A0A158Q3F4_DRAME
LNFDRFVEHFDDSTITKVRKQYWTTKQFIRKKLGKKEDEYLLASDAEFDAKISIFRSLRETSEQMLFCVDDYQHYLTELVQSEIALGKMLKNDGEEDKTEAGKVMCVVGRVISLSAHNRLFMRSPLLRFLSELQVFIERAILDCAATVDPDAGIALEKFRIAQSVVRKNKEKLDGLKLDTLQKVDLLAASRCNLFSQLLETYQKFLYRFYEQTTAAYSKIYGLVSGHKHYRFEVLKELMDPVLDSEDNQKLKEDAVNSNSENCSLISIDTKENEIDSILLGLEAMEMEIETFDQRLESPLGQAPDNNLLNSSPIEDKPIVGPLPIKELDAKEIPKIIPPPGWKANRTETNYTNDLMELLSFNNPAQSELDSFALEWSKIATPTTINNSNTHTSSLNMGNLPSQLLDTQNFQSQNFPNPFTDSNFSAWNGLILEFESSENNSGRIC